ncbi:MAG: TolB family protein [Candidatus Hodarchaeota archaeon]
MKKTLWYLIIFTIVLANVTIIFGYSLPIVKTLDQLTTDPSAEFYPSWSPDGNIIAYASNNESGNWVIKYMAPDGSNQTQITPFPGWDFCPAWNHNGTKLSYLHGGPYPNMLELWVMDRDGKNSHPLREEQISSISEWQPPIPWSLPSWNNDSTKIAFSGYLSGEDSYDIWIVTANGNNLWSITDHERFDTDAAWSPIENLIAFQSWRAGNWDVWVINPDDKLPIQLTYSPADDIQPSWSPDGSMLAFVSNRTGNCEIWVMNSDGSDPQQLTISPSDDFYPTWSPDGKNIAFASCRSGNWDIWVMSLTTLTSTPTPEPELSSQPEINLKDVIIKIIMQNLQYVYWLVWIPVGIAAFIYYYYNILRKRENNSTINYQKKIEMFQESKEALRKASGLLKGHLRHLEEEGDEYHAKGRIPGEIENIIQHSSILSSIGNKTEKKKIRPILEEGKKYSELKTTEQFLNFKKEIHKWADKANSIEIDLN